MLELSTSVPLSGGLESGCKPPRTPPAAPPWRSPPFRCPGRIARNGEVPTGLQRTKPKENAKTSLAPATPTWSCLHGHLLSHRRPPPRSLSKTPKTPTPSTYFRPHHPAQNISARFKMRPTTSSARNKQQGPPLLGPRRPAPLEASNEPNMEVAGVQLPSSNPLRTRPGPMPQPTRTYQYPRPIRSFGRHPPHRHGINSISSPQGNRSSAGASCCDSVVPPTTSPFQLPTPTFGLPAIVSPTVTSPATAHPASHHRPDVPQSHDGTGIGDDPNRKTRNYFPSQKAAAPTVRHPKTTQRLRQTGRPEFMQQGNPLVRQGNRE